MTVSRPASRIVLFLMAFSGLVLAIIILLYVGRGGRIHQEAITDTIGVLLEVYVPLLSIMAAFYFAERHKDHVSENLAITAEAFMFSALLALLWTAAPPLLIAASQTIEEAVSMINALSGYGVTLAAGAITYVFARTHG